MTHPPTTTLPPRADLVVVGSGIVGLAHALEAVDRGLSVVVIERGATLTGASVRNFGHACVSAQSGLAREFAALARERWLRLAREAGFWARESGATVVARRPEEVAVLEEFVASDDGDRLTLLTAAQVTARVPVDPGAVVGGGAMAADLQIDPRAAAPAIADWLARRGVTFVHRTSVLGVETGRVHTSRGEIEAGRVVIAVNHDLDHLFPELAEEAGLLRCRLHMMRCAPTLAGPLTTPLLTGWSLLRYSAFAGLPSAALLRDRLAEVLPAGLELDLNQMYTQLPDGSLIVGDTHERALDAVPFQSERGFDLLTQVTRELFGLAELPVLERWQGVYASSPDREFVLAHPLPGVAVVTVATGIGMTTALGIAPRTLGDPSTVS